MHFYANVCSLHRNTKIRACLHSKDPLFSHFYFYFQIHEDLTSQKSVGVHWGTFRLTYEYFLEPKTKILELVKEAGLDAQGNKKLNFEVVNIGATVEGL